jgi:hypothetical protein
MDDTVHIVYPTDTRLLSECRQISEGLIDELYQANTSQWPVKPRTYRVEAEMGWRLFEGALK